MNEHRLANGNTLHIPDTPQREPQTVGDGTKRYQCICHKKMGNDFWFLPIGSCIRGPKGVECDHTRTD